MSFLTGRQSTKPPVPNLNDIMQEKIESFVSAFFHPINKSINERFTNLEKKISEMEAKLERPDREGGGVENPERIVENLKNQENIAENLNVIIEDNLANISIVCFHKFK